MMLNANEAGFLYSQLGALAGERESTLMREFRDETSC
jgi:hypothetical protein